MYNQIIIIIIFLYNCCNLINQINSILNYCAKGKHKIDISKMKELYCLYTVWVDNLQVVVH